MAKFSITSPNKEILNLSNSVYFDLIKIENQTFNENTISSLQVAGSDGDIVNNVATNPRNITISLYLRGNVEISKRYILRYCKPKLKHVITWEQEKRTVQIEGVLQSVDLPRWENGLVMTLSFYCSNPFWLDKNITRNEISNGIGLHYFTTEPNNQLAFYQDGIVMGVINAIHTQTFYNDGDVSTGLTIEIFTQDGIINPIVYGDNGEYIGVNKTLGQGDHLEITTGKGNKDIKLNDVSIIGDIMDGSTFLQMKVGENTFRIDSDGGEINNVYMSLNYRKAYI